MGGAVGTNMKNGTHIGCTHGIENVNGVASGSAIVVNHVGGAVGMNSVETICAENCVLACVSIKHVGGTAGANDVGGKTSHRSYVLGNVDVAHVINGEVGGTVGNNNSGVLTENA